MKQSFLQEAALILMACLCLWAAPIAAEDVSSFQLDLKSEKLPRPVRSLGEFDVSLDSKLVPQRTLADTLRPNRDLVDLPRAVVIPLAATPTGDEAVTGDTPATDEEGMSPLPTSLSSTFTFRPGYLQTKLPNRFSARPATGGRSQSGRLSLSGLAEREPVPFTVIRPPTPVPVFANRVQPQGSLPAAAPGSLMQLSPANPQEAPPIVDNYLLEATYNFNPAVQGKVSYQRSQFDPTLKTEDLQVEGTVDTGRNTAIKAGFQNRSTPAAQSGTGHKKVFTEFILKF